MELEEWVLRSKALLEELKDCQGDRAQFEAALCGYIQCRFMLERRPGPGESLYALAEESAAVMARIPSPQLSAMEAVSGCRGASSGAVKKVFLLMSLKKALGWDLSQEDAAGLVTVADLADCARRCRTV